MSQQPITDHARQDFVNPTQATTDYVWKIIISAIGVVLVGSFLAIAIAVFLKVDTGLIQILLTVFTSMVTFVGGLLIKSPVQQPGG